jgi:integrase
MDHSPDTIKLMDGKVNLYRRDNSKYWQCSTFMKGRNYRTSTKEEHLIYAKDYAEQWYMSLYLQLSPDRQSHRIHEMAQRYALENRQELRPRKAPAARPGQTPQQAPIRGKEPTPREVYAPRQFHLPQQVNIQDEPTFREASVKFLKEFIVITKGERSDKYVEGQALRIKVHLLPYFGDMPVASITSATVQEYRVHRQTYGHKGRIPSRASLHSETVALRMILKTAHRYGWIHSVPDISPPYKTSGKVKHRAWFSPDEYKMLYEATREKAKTAKHKALWEDFHDYVLFMANTGLRPDEAARLQYRDVTIVMDEDSGERLLEIEVRGKRGIGFCKSMTGAIHPFQRMQKRHDGKPADTIFGRPVSVQMNTILNEINLKHDRDGNVRTAYSLRHTYICLRLMEGADIYQVAKNCRTSVEMIEKFYASHLKNTLDASAINVRKPKKKPKKD